MYTWSDALLTVNCFAFVANYKTILFDDQLYWYQMEIIGKLITIQITTGRQFTSPLRLYTLIAMLDIIIKSSIALF